ncbi:hypothetical protein FHY55_18045 [Oceanicola sp. D3]|uniref:zinc-ribbon domain-containing protein n=1 Tax=Oceanicola sp. D3 TaxID=2587163 RepID=UPI00111D8DCC|nr:zinc-ribbon domain-containing protein [Oceanicola sp. D3]QDC11016.1 hypothetical protein FHY55_18045 [Oceanicola sp. D3]
MRLVCPNCGAQYNVDDGAIPEAGRDVQCSSCGHGWFQKPEGSGEAPSLATRIASQPGPKRETTKIATGGPDQASREAAASGAPEQRTGRRALDTAVMDVLREEAEREKAARAAESAQQPQPPAQPEPIPVPEPAPAPAPAAEAPAPAEPEQAAPQPAPEPAPAPKPEERQVASETHKAKIRGENPVVAVAALSGRAVQRKEMLPDIEQINSTLRASADPSRAAEEAGAADEAEKRKAKRGFRIGFGLVAVLALAATLIYTQSPRIAAAVPAVEGPLTSYVAAVNDGRRWLDNTLRGASSE